MTKVYLFRTNLVRSSEAEALPRSVIKAAHGKQDMFFRDGIKEPLSIVDPILRQKPPVTTMFPA